MKPEPPDKPRKPKPSGEKAGDGDMPPTDQRRATDAQTESAVPAAQPGDDIMDVLSEFETGLESLKALYSQRQRLQSRIREQEDQCKQRETAVAQRAAELERVSQEQQKKAAEVDRVSQEQQKLAAELEESRRQFAKDQEVRQQEWGQIEVVRAQSAAAAAAHEAKSKELTARIESLGQQLEQAKSEATRYAQHAAKLESGNGEADAKARDAAARATKSEQELRSQTDHLNARIAELETKWTHEKSNAAQLSAALVKHQADAAELEKVVGELKARFKDEVGSQDEVRKQLESAEDSLAKANSRAETLQTKLTALLAEVAAFKEQAEKQPKNSKVLMPASTASILRRRQRLKLYRDLVREQSLKVRKANDALKKKIETCEQVLAQRSELAMIRDRVLEAERRLQRRAAGNRSVVTLLCTLAVVAVLAALSWTLAREVAPATYMATSAIKADGRSRELNRAELEEWTSFHTAMLKDPMFHEAAADRFKRAGFAKLGTPEAVAELIRNDVSSESPNPGELQLHLKATGQDRTQRTLETFTAALASQANAQLTKRIDGGVTAVSLQATVAGEPLDNTRMLYFVGILMMGMTACIVFVAALWKRLSRAKTAFEQDEVVSNALDDTKWAAFAAAAAAQQGSMAVKNKAARE
jgi:chemotaxis protein histidine kinase CheA